MMTHDEAKAQFGIYSNKSRPRSLQIGKFLIMMHWGDACWDTLTAKNECQTDWIRLGTIRDLGGLRAYQFVLWRMVLTWSSFK